MRWAYSRHAHARLLERFIELHDRELMRPVLATVKPTDRFDADTGTLGQRFRSVFSTSSARAVNQILT
jgi:hypothetical protein